MIRPTYGAMLKEAIMDNNVEIIENLIAPINHTNECDYGAAYGICNLGTVEGLKRLMNAGVDLSHPWFDQPECFIKNQLLDRNGYKQTKEYLEYLISNCIDVNAICIETYYCMHNDSPYSNLTVVREHSSFNSVPTLIDSIELDMLYGDDVAPFISEYVIELLRANGGKSGAELGYTHEQAERLLKYKFNKNINYSYLKEKKALLHSDLIAYLYHPDRINKYLETNDDVENYLM